MIRHGEQAGAGRSHSGVATALICAALSLAASSVRADCYDRDRSGHQTRFRLAAAEAIDQRTGLIWQRCSVGNSWSDNAGCKGAVSYLGLDQAIAAASSAGDGWRVPSGAELESLVDSDCGSPVVDTTVFPDIVPTEEGLAKYWTVTPYGMLDLYWNFDFVDGHPDSNSRGIRLAVRLVRSAGPDTKPNAD